MVTIENPITSTAKPQHYVRLLVALTLVALLGLGAASFRFTELAAWVNPRFGILWAFLALPLLHLAIAAASGSRPGMRSAGLLCLGLSVGNTLLLLRSGTVDVARVSLSDQVHAAWFWQVGLLAIIGFLLIGDAFLGARRDRLPQVDQRSFLQKLRLLLSLFPRSGDGMWTQLARAPFVLQLFVPFAICGAIAECVLLVLNFATPSHFLMIAAYVTALTNVRLLLSEHHVLRKQILQCAVLLAFFGIMFVAMSGRAGELTNPSVLNTIRVVLPFFWAAMFVSPAMLKWSGFVTSSTYVPFQHSIVDWAYLASVVAIAATACAALN